MTNFYDELNINENGSLEEINQTLTQLESTWKRREITHPEKATTMLAMIIQARKAFYSEDSRREYDRELAKSKENPVEDDPNTERKKQFQKWYDDARSYFDDRQYDLAKTAVEKALSYYDQTSDNDVFLALAAKIYSGNDNHTVALDYINKAIIIRPDDAMHYISKAIIYHVMASSGLRYNNQSEVQLIQNARDALEHAISTAHRQDNKNAESAAYGLLAYNHYFVPAPDRDKAEEYANKSVALGNVWGNASKVLEDIELKRQQEAKAAEEQRLREEQSAREEKRRRREELQREKEQQRKEHLRKIMRACYKLCWLGFFMWTGFVVYQVISFEGTRFNLWLHSSDEAINIGLMTLGFFVITAVLNLFEKLCSAGSVFPEVVSSFIFFIYVFYISVYFMENNDYSEDITLGWIGVNYAIHIVVMIITNKIGHAVQKRME